MTAHKIQSKDLTDGLTMKLDNVPKILKYVREKSLKTVFISFKLETDVNIL